jgi:hypothetical protein
MAYLETCHRCGTSYEAVRSDSRWCGNSCRAAARRDTVRARVAALLALHSATVREGMARLDMDAVRPELDRIAAELDALVA